EAFREKDLDWLAEQGLTRIVKERFGLAVDEADAPGEIAHDEGIGRQLHDGAEGRLWTFGRSHWHSGGRAAGARLPGGSIAGHTLSPTHGQPEWPDLTSTCPDCANRSRIRAN